MDSDDSTGAHFDHLIGKNGGVLAVVCDVHHCQIESVAQACKLRSQFGAKPRIETRERLVQQENARTANDRSCERHALLFSAGQLVRIALGELLDPNQCECLLYPPASLGSRYLCRAEHEVEILANFEMRPQREVLEHEAESS